MCISSVYCDFKALQFNVKLLCIVIQSYTHACMHKTKFAFAYYNVYHYNIILFTVASIFILHVLTYVVCSCMSIAIYIA